MVTNDVYLIRSVCFASCGKSSAGGLPLYSVGPPRPARLCRSYWFFNT